MSCAGHILQYLCQQEWKKVQTAKEKESITSLSTQEVVDSYHHSLVGANMRKLK